MEAQDEVKCHDSNNAGMMQRREEMAARRREDVRREIVANVLQCRGNGVSAASIIEEAAAIEKYIFDGKEPQCASSTS